LRSSSPNKKRAGFDYLARKELTKIAARKRGRRKRAIRRRSTS
jgi:hypothetical protein